MGKLLTFWWYIRRYKYVVALLIFLLILGVLDENSLWVRYQRRVEISNLHRQIEKYQAQYDAETAQLEALENNPAAVERLAREKYLMKRDNEDLFVFMDANEYQVRNEARTRRAAVQRVSSDNSSATTAADDSLTAQTDSIIE